MLKKICFVFSLIFYSLSFSQNIVMQNATINQCSGVFYDSGGEFGNYASNEDFILTICPENAGQKVQVEFLNFNIESNRDVLTIYNGDSVLANSFGAFSGTTNPGLVRASLDNTSGCITFEFISDGSINGIGWEANISCITPCQTINSQLDSTDPIPNLDGYIRVCVDEEITFNGSGTFSNDGTGATYQWDLGDGTTLDGQSVTYSYDTPGVYLVNLNIRDTNTSENADGCTNNNLINQVVQVSTRPDFTGTEAIKQTICLGDSTTLSGVVSTVEFINDCTPPVSGTTFLPDGAGLSYETSITVDCFDNDQVLDDISQLVSICINMEHSFLGDLTIEIVSPNGQTVRMHNQGGGSANLGIPWATDTIDNNSEITTPGIGSNYCFVPGSENPTLVGGIQANGVFPLGNGPGTYTDLFVPEGNYSSVFPLTGLLGSPLNGNWTLRVTDNISLDNGYVFEWSINFDSAIQPTELSFKPVILNQEWDADSSIINTNENTITVQPTDVGEYCYTYRVVDDFGCEYTHEVCIDVQEVPLANSDSVPIKYEQCNSNFEIDGNPSNESTIFDLSTQDSQVLDGQSPANFRVSYYLSQVAAELGENPLPNLYRNQNNPQEIWARVDNIDTPQSICFAIAPITLQVNPLPAFNLEPQYNICFDQNGTEVIDLAIINTGLSDTDYTFEWSYNGTLIPDEIRSNLVPSQGGTYTVTVTDTSTSAITSCEFTQSTEVIESAPPSLVLSLNTRAFADSHEIEAVATGIGVYEYNIDNGPWQDSGTFTNVSIGTHTITARDKNGCGLVSESITVIDYPLYFTPNGDGVNDRWNVVGLNNQPSAKIYIFDRYGKLLKQLSPVGSGWDGTFNGQIMPSNDYWFVVEYQEPSTGETQEFRAHFTLKR
jgi:gliding motility-associated-like protein